MADPIPSDGLQITPSAISVQLQGQLRIWIAGLAGAVVAAAANRWHLPILNSLWGAQGDQVVALLVGALTLASMAGWQWARTKLVNSRWWALATNHRVPNDLVRPADNLSLPTPKE